MQRKILLISMMLLAGIFLTRGASVQAADSGLVQLLTSKLGVTEQQATGGAGSIFSLAKENLGANDFTQIAKAVPGIDTMISAAPKTEGAAGMLQGASSLFGSSAPSMNGLTSLAWSFSQLGMKADMVNAFIPIILDYVKSKGGEPLMQLLQGALK